jgi:hypothetical protein
MKKIIPLFVLSILITSSITIAQQEECTEKKTPTDNTAQDPTYDTDPIPFDFIEEFSRWMHSLKSRISFFMGNYFKIGPLLKTSWKQEDKYNLYNKYAPIKDLRKDHHRLGCWSTALAQILYYYQSGTYGVVSYETSPGCAWNGESCHIEEDLNREWNWGRFVFELTQYTQDIRVDEVAKYCYFTSVVIQKDLGTDGYVIKHDERSDAVEDHYYSIRSNYYTTWDGKYTVDYLKNIVISEIMQGFPVVMHLNKKNTKKYHAVVVDGVSKRNDVYKFHLNTGDGSRDGHWYEGFDKFDYWDNESYRTIMTVRKFELGPFGFHIPLEKRIDPLLNKNTLLAELNMRDPEEFLQYLPQDGYDSPWMCFSTEPPETSSRGIPDDLWENDPP